MVEKQYAEMREKNQRGFAVNATLWANRSSNHEGVR
jgi:hypothetical protein